MSLPLKLSLRGKQAPKSRSGDRSGTWMHVRLAGLAILLTAGVVDVGLGQVAPIVDVGAPTAYFSNSIWTGVGEPIRAGVILVREGKIVAVGKRRQVKIPANAKRVLLGSNHIIPGLIAAESDFAIQSTPDESLTPETMAIDGFDFFGDRDSLLAEGITTIQLAAGQSRLMPGKTAVVKLAGDDLEQRILVDNEAIQIILTQAAFNPPTIYEPPVGAVSVDRPLEPTRPQLASSLGQAVSGLRAIFDAAKTLEGDSDGLTDANRWLADLAAWKSAEKTYRITARSRPEVRAACQLIDELQLSSILVNPTSDAALIPLLKNCPNLSGIILRSEDAAGTIPNLSIPDSNDLPKMPLWEFAAQLQDSKLKDRIAVLASNDNQIDELRFAAGQFQKAGLNESAVLKLVTSNAARILGVDDRVGQIAEGMDADFVILSDAPFRSGSQVLETFVNGTSVWRQSDSLDSNVEPMRILTGAKVQQADGTFVAGSIAVRGNKILSIGQSQSIPPGSKTQKFLGCFITPGFIDCSSNLGVGATLTDRIALGTKLGEQLVRQGERIAYARQGGTSTVLLSSTNLPSPVVAFRLTDIPYVLQDPVAIQFSVDSNLVTAEKTLANLLGRGKQYDDAWKKYEAERKDYEERLAIYKTELAKWEAEQKKAETEKAEAAKKAESQKKGDSSTKSTQKPSEDAKESEKTDAPNNSSDQKETKKPSDDSDDKEPPQKDASKQSDEKSGNKEADDSKPKAPSEPKAPKKEADLEPYRQLFAKKIPAMVQVDSDKEVKLATELFCDKFGCQVVLLGGKACYEGLPIIKSNASLSIAVGPTLIDEIDNARVNLAASLSLGNSPILFQSRADIGLRNIASLFDHAVHHGLGQRDALRLLTSNPSATFSLESVGVIAPGAFADLVVFDGPPFAAASKIVAVMIDGEWVFSEKK